MFISRTGVFYGQCSELCGVGHGFMPITAVVSGRVSYFDWLLKSASLRNYFVYAQIVLEELNNIRKEIFTPRLFSTAFAEEEVAPKTSTISELDQELLKIMDMPEPVRRGVY